MEKGAVGVGEVGVKAAPVYGDMGTNMIKGRHGVSSLSDRSRMTTDGAKAVKVTGTSETGGQIPKDIRTTTLS